MIRLDEDDLRDPDKLAALAAAAGMTPDAFRGRFAYLVEP
jgi:2-hydroxychromene-2-carboxylate isomerase